eukprot:5675010-Pleurochrysis_carterae.AAC.1
MGSLQGSECEVVTFLLTAHFKLHLRTVAATRVQVGPRTRMLSRTAHAHAKLHPVHQAVYRTRTPSHTAHSRPLGVRRVCTPKYAQHADAAQGAERADRATCRAAEY